MSDVGERARRGEHIHAEVLIVVEGVLRAQTVAMLLTQVGQVGSAQQTNNTMTGSHTWSCAVSLRMSMPASAASSCASSIQGIKAMPCEVCQRI